MLEATVFLCGCLVMVLEMTGGRVLAPHVGTSAIVWTSLIGVILAFLAAGAWAGGKFADKKLSGQGLSQTLTGAALGCLLTALFHTAIGKGVTSGISNLYLAAVIAAICIFAFPAFFFGAITPYVIRLRIASVDTAGATVGRLYALSTAGSILGTFLGGFVLISWFSSTTILWSITIFLLALSLALYPAKPYLRIILLGMCIFLCWQDNDYAKWLADKGDEILIESPYNSIRIMEGEDRRHNNAKVRLMATDPGYTQSGILMNDPAELYFNYTRFYGLGPKLAPHAKSVLMLGGGGYSVPKWLLANKSMLDQDISIVTVEIDPAMTESAKKYFGLPEDERHKIIHADARAFLNRQKDKFDLVFVDVFNSHYSIPFQMGTKEAMEALNNALAPEGIVLMNLISAVEGEDGRLFRAIWQNFDKTFADAKVYCVSMPSAPQEVQNLMLVGKSRDTNRSLAERVNITNNLNIYKSTLSPTNREIEAMAKNLYPKPVAADVPPLTDDFAPVDLYALMLAR